MTPIAHHSSLITHKPRRPKWMAGFLLPLLLLTPLASVAQVDTLFWFAQPDVWRRYTTLPVNYCVTTFDQPATVTIDMPADPSFAPITFSVPANSFHQHNVASLYSQMVTSTSNAPRNRGLRIRATAPVSCYFEVTGDNSEIYTLKGRNALGTDFLVPTQTIYPNHPTFSISSSIEIVATEDDTQLEITPRVPLSGGVAAGSTTFFSLNRGQTYRVRSSSLSANGHLYNTLIHTTKPVAVNSTDDLVEPTANADLVGEQILPVNQIGRRYVALNSFYNISSPNQHLYSSNIFIFPTQDNTIVTVNGGPLSPIHRGSSLSFRLSGPATLIEANNPIVVFQTTTSGFEMGGTMLPHLECTGSHRVVHKVPSDIDQQPKLAIVVATEHKARFTLNGNPMPASWFQTVPGDPTLSYSLRTVSIPADSIISVENNAGRFQMGIIDLTFNVGASCTYGYFSDYAQASYVHLLMDTLQCSDSAVVFTYDAPNIDNLTLTGPDGFELTAPPFVIPADAPHLSGRYHLSGVDTANCHNLLSDSVDITFRRCNTRIALPYCEDFDSYPYGEGNMPDYWTGYNTLNIDNGRYPLITREYHRSGNQSFGFHIMNNNRCYAILPDFAVDSIQQLNLSFFARIKPSERGQLVMGVLTDSTDINTFIPLDTLNISHLQWQPVTYSYSHYHGPARRAAMLDIQLPGYTFGNIYIDDFAAGLWQQPSIQVSSPSSITVTAAPGQSEDFWIEYGAPGFHPGVDPSTIVHITSSPFLVTGLQPSTTYDIYAYPYLDDNTLVRSTCNAPVTVSMPQPPPETIIDTSVCINHLPLVWHSHTLLSDTSISDTLAIPLGYDSIVTLHLSLLPTYSIDTLASPCDQIAWRGHTFTSDTLFVDSLIATNGCDSVTTLHLTLRHSSAATILDTALENDLPRTLLGHSFLSDTADVAITTANAQGCDSLVSYSLHVLWNNRTSLDSTVCQSLLPLQWNHHTFHAAGTLLDTLVNTLGSDSIIAMTLHVAPTFDDTLAVSICDNQTYGFEGTTYNLAGTYSHLLHTAAFGCDSLRTLNLDVRSTSSGDTIANPCDGLLWRGTTFNSDTVIADTTILHSVFSTNAVGCDSVTTLHLTLRHSSTATILDTALENDLPRTLLGHSFLSDTADVAIATANAQGCDSLVSYSLHVHRNCLTNLDTSVCANELPFVWHSKSFADNGTTPLRDTLWLNASSGADSTVALSVDVHPVYDLHIYDTLCDNQSLSFESQELSSPGTYEYSLSTHTYACDSLRTLHLTVHPTYSGILYDTICQNQSYSWGTHLRDIHLPDSTLRRLPAADTAIAIPAAANTITLGDTLTSIHGCDSVSQLSLTVHPVLDIHYYDTACYAAHGADGWDTLDYPFEGQHFDATTLYTHHAASGTTGCDSLRTLHLEVAPTYDRHFFDTIYQGDAALFEGHEYTVPGRYEHPLSTVLRGCDSILTLHLTVAPVSRFDTTLCRNHLPLLWHGQSFPSVNGIAFSGNRHTLVDSLHTPLSDGRDSLTVFTLTLLDTSARTDVVLACGNYTWIDSVNYTASTQSPAVTFANAFGCDSVVHLDLRLTFTQTIDDYHSPCDSLVWLDGRVFRNDTVGIIDTLHTLSGCDSIMRLHLTLRHSSHIDLADTSCPHNAYSWHSFSIPADTSGRFLLFDTLVNAEGCDSTLRLDLFKPGETVIDIVSDLDCRLHGHHVTATATAALAAADSLTLPHLAWSARPADPLLDSLLQSPGYTFTSGATILLQPAVETQYTLTADYSATHRCPDTATITLKPVVTPQVQLKVTPLLMPYSERRFTAYDLDYNHSYARTWYIDNESLGDHSPVIHGQASFDADSVIVTLELADSICSDTATRVIHIDDLAVYAPNAFTPSREDNNRFVIVTRGVVRGELTIYQRDGLLVYHTDDYTQGWDGRTSDGTPCIQGNYVWKLVYQPTLWPGTQRTQVGSILLIR